MEVPPHAIGAIGDGGRLTFTVPGPWPSRGWLVVGAMVGLGITASVVSGMTPIDASEFLQNLAPVLGPVWVAASAGMFGAYRWLAHKSWSTTLSLDAGGVELTNPPLFGRGRPNVRRIGWGLVARVDTLPQAWEIVLRDGERVRIPSDGWDTETRDAASRWFVSLVAELQDPDLRSEARIALQQRALAARVAAQ